MTLLRYAAFQVVWFAAVLGAAGGSPWLGLVAGLAFVGLQVTLLARDRRASELVLITAAVFAGVAFESLYGFLGVVRYGAGWDLTGLALDARVAPPWILGLWAALAACASNLFAWLRGRVLLAAVIGAVGGTLSLRAGASFGALELGPPALWIPAVAGEWALLFPLLVEAPARLRNRTKGPERIAGPGTAG